MKNNKEIYEKKIKYYTGLSSKISRAINTISLSRLILGIFIIVVSIIAYKYKTKYIPKAILLLSVVSFIYLVVVHRKYRNMNKYIDILKDINTSALKRLSGEWIEFNDKGNEFIDGNHRYSGDLDIFGQGSLFQWINCSNTYMGRESLAKILNQSYPETYFCKESINKRQEAIKELAGKLWWRQKLQAEVMSTIKEDKDKIELLKWTNSKNDMYSKPWIIFILRLLPIVTITTIILGNLLDIIPKYISLLFLCVQSILILINSKNANIESNLAYKYQKSIKAYEKILSHFEKGRFSSSYIKALKVKLINNNGLSVVKQLKRLETIVDNLLNRNNIYFLPINVVLLWDYQCMISLDKWKRQNGILVGVWMDVIGEIEALSSLSNIQHDYPEWATPIITEKSSVFEGKSVGHPLITNKQVCNDISITEPSRILLITGSNMSGKSTLLRTIGINLILAYSGAPVCAKYMKTSVMYIYTCMRTSDNLEQGISSFYGELLRIKSIISESKKDKQIFFLLDEIFKGTNSYDRHIGAKMLINQLYKNNAVGLVSTHDLELGDLEKENNGNIKNYHFQEHYKNDKIHFDYKLREGVSTTRNALYLIRMAGIEEI
ncbi:DNA mismatch repair protein MutS [Gottschalkia acidurici 9a]|uniref:DNA mismatch repair protein MutS n=1 Tax=Gottschalkia acidurici (strain ATCC 7906 / DSM 604 / BCRC 14475 / CIP 104303 / KCTC 5404 / NCIMB 10678 / 9a) TaxID=1128398 RepID=K0B1Q0_GOTA9|nr:MutS family DNA mismatch repair protein [Gottschalkia acidurici]AFS78870.1 DNA mismatch repair protein MutS [Gottschalkia acidurici 9a]